MGVRGALEKVNEGKRDKYVIFSTIKFSFKVFMSDFESQLF